VSGVLRAIYHLTITNHHLPITLYQLPLTNNRLPFTIYQLPITSYQSPGFGRGKRGKSGEIGGKTGGIGGKKKKKTCTEMHKKKTSSNLSYPMFSGGEKNSCLTFAVIGHCGIPTLTEKLLFYLFLLDFTLCGGQRFCNFHLEFNICL
jgi:hypothetical protein